MNYDCIAVTATTGLPGGSGTDIYNLVYGEFHAIQPGNDPGKHCAIGGKVRIDGDKDLCWLLCCGIHYKNITPSKNNSNRVISLSPSL